MIEFIWPQTNGEWLAWTSAFYLLTTGILMLVMPRIWARVMGQDGTNVNNESIALIRGPLAGGNIGFALVVLMLHPQPLLYLALGGMFAFSSIGRLISLFVDTGNPIKKGFTVMLDAILAIFPIAFALGYIS